MTINGKSVVKPGNDVQFECDYTGSQKTAWFKEQERISESNKQGKSNVKTSVKNLGYNKQSLKLNLTNVSVSDSGRYRCSVEFDNTRVFSTDIKLTVFGKCETMLKLNFAVKRHAHARVLRKAWENYT